MSDTLSQFTAERRGPGRPSNAEIAARAAAVDPTPAAQGAGDEMARRRANRKPFGSHVQKLAYPPRPGYHRHWFNDDEGRPQLAQEAGYEFVNDQAKNEPISRVVGLTKAGQPMLAYLMEIPQEWYDEDMQRQYEKTRELERSIRRGDVIAGKSAQDSDAAFYPTAQGRSIKISR